MNQIKKAVLIGLGFATAYAAAETIGTVKAIREGVDGAYFNQARAAVFSDGSVAAKAGMKIPAGQFNVDVLGVYTGKPSLAVAVLGDRVGIEATLASGKKTGTIEGTVAGVMGQATLISTDAGLAQTIRASDAQQFGPITAQLGASVTRNAENAYAIGADVFLLASTKVGSTSLFPYVGASLDTKLSGYKYAGIVIAPDGNKLSLKPTLGNGGNLTHINAYTAGVELRAAF
jgi:hypothetical protein